ncbi:MAG: DUF4058 family protein [Chloroflexi bacterium]|nr:DUF4058 family protein [Chloroflexota bacterium]
MRTQSPFPGMDPYLEDREFFPGFHYALGEEIRRHLNEQIGPKYYADVQVSTESQDIFIGYTYQIYPDVGVYEPALSIRGAIKVAALASAAPIQRRVVLEQELRLRSVRVYVTETSELVTAIEILSPYNKRGEGLEAYRKKRNEIFKSQTHFVELDLLRGGTRPGLEINEPPLDTDYVLVVSRAGNGIARISEIWPLALNEPFPVLPVPLREPDPDATLNLNEISQFIYPRAGYGWRIDYTRPVPPPELRPAMKEWMQTQFSIEEPHG